MKYVRGSAVSTYNPVASATLFCAVLVITMFGFHPVILALSLAGSLLFYISLAGPRALMKDLLFYLPLSVLIAITNPLFSHNGMTPLFFMNGNAVTLEAVYYGIAVAAMLAAVVFWCKCWSLIMTTDKLLYLFGKPFAKLSLVLSTSLRFLPALKRKWEEIREAQTAIGYDSARGFADKLGKAARVFSALVTWALESSVETGQSMAARGYGLKPRTNFSLYRFGARDTFFAVCCDVFAAAVFCGFARGALAFPFYPAVSAPAMSPEAVAAYISFGALALLPCCIEIKEKILWNYFESKI